MADVFVNRGSKTIGPVSTQKLRALVASGKVRQTDQIGRSENGPWQPAGEVRGIFSDAVTAGEPAPTPPPLTAGGGGWFTTTKLFVISGVVITGIAITVVAVLFLGGEDDTASAAGDSESVASQETTSDDTPGGTAALANETPPPATNSEPAPPKTTSESPPPPEELQVLKRLEELGVERIDLPQVSSRKTFSLAGGGGKPVMILKLPRKFVEPFSVTQEQLRLAPHFKFMPLQSPLKPNSQFLEEVKKLDATRVLGQSAVRSYVICSEQSLVFRDRIITATALKALPTQLSGLTSLSVKRTRENGDESVGAVTQFASQFSRLRFLSLERTRLTDLGLKQLSGLSQLVWLDVAGNILTGTGLTHLRGLASLKVLFCRGNKINGPGLANIKGLPNLEILDLGGNDITDAGLVSLEELTQLVSLDIGGNLEVTDGGLVHLKNLTKLEQLGLRNTQTTNAGLLQLKELKNLKSISLTGTKDTAAGVAELKKTLPDVNVIGP